MLLFKLPFILFLARMHLIDSNGIYNVEKDLYSK